MLADISDTYMHQVTHKKKLKKYEILASCAAAKCDYKNQIAREICYIEAPINRIYVWLVLQWAAWFHANGAACVLSSLYCMHTTTA